MRSVVVVFPASMWAMMPMLRYRSSGVWRGISIENLAEASVVASRKLNQQKCGWTVALLETGAGIHPLPPGALATVARMGTQGRAEPMLGDRLSCVAFRERRRPMRLRRFRRVDDTPIVPGIPRAVRGPIFAGSQLARLARCTGIVPVHRSL